MANSGQTSLHPVPDSVYLAPFYYHPAPDSVRPASDWINLAQNKMYPGQIKGHPGSDDFAEEPSR